MLTNQCYRLIWYQQIMKHAFIKLKTKYSAVRNTIIYIYVHVIYIKYKNPKTKQNILTIYIQSKARLHPVFKGWWVQRRSEVGMVDLRWAE